LKKAIRSTLNQASAGPHKEIDHQATAQAVLLRWFFKPWHEICGGIILFTSDLC